MKVECCVHGCRSHRSMPRHVFPKNQQRFLSWKQAVFSEKIASLSDTELRNRFVCYRHFKEEDYIVGLKNRRLKHTAVPSLKLSCDEENTGVSISDINVEVSENVQPSCSFEVQGGSTAHDTCSVARNTAVESQVSENEQPSCFFEVQGESTALDTCSIARNIAVETQAAGNECRSLRIQAEQTPQQKRKRRLCLLERRVISAQLTPQKAKLYRTAQLLQRRQTHSRKQLSTLRERLKGAKKFYTSKSLQQVTHNLSPTQEAFLLMQLRASQNAAQGRRYSEKEKILCLSIYKQSGKAYRFLETIFHLPSARVLQRLLRTFVLQPGLNKNLMDHLAQKTLSMSSLDKICCLMWDEASIQPHVDFSPVLQRIVGFEDYGNMRRPKFTDVVLVFMLRGIKTGWKLPLSFYFSDSQTNSSDLKACIKEVTEAVVNSGLRIVAYVCDQGTANVRAVNDLVAETASQAPANIKLSGNIIYMNGQEIVSIYDPPHLIKGVRNNLLTKDLRASRLSEDGEDYLSWKTIELAYKMDQTDAPVRQMRNITDRHITPHRIKKMRVKHAVQVLSETMAAFIGHHVFVRGPVYSAWGPLYMPVDDGKAAAKVILFFNNLFDSCNGSTKEPERKYRVAVSAKSPHVKFWSDAVAQLQQMQFVDPTDRQTAQRSAVLRNWITTIQGFQSINIILQGEGFKYWFPRYINQDPLENFFGSVRCLGFRDTKPTAVQFINHFKTLIINNISTRPSAYSNCENKDAGNVLFDLSILLRAPNNYNIEIDEGNVTYFESSPTSQTCQHIDPQLLHTIVKSFSNLESLQSCQSCDINVKENLAAPCAQAQLAIKQYLPLNCHRADIIFILKTMLDLNVDFYFSKCDHEQQVKNLFFDTSARVFLQNWSIHINKILMGKKTPRAPADSIEILAVSKFRKTLKKFRKIYPPSPM